MTLLLVGYFVQFPIECKPERKSGRDTCISMIHLSAYRLWSNIAKEKRELIAFPETGK